jgi:hypothetical protein
MCLLYADDALVFLQPQEQQLRLFKVIMQLFHQLSGLKVNLQKSVILVTLDHPQEAQRLAAILQCTAAVFPITYLGLPLSNKSLRKRDYLSLIQQEERRLSGWKAEMLSPRGRLTLLNSVLTTLPIYYMSAFLLPKWLIIKIDRVRRRFLWQCNKEAQGQKRPVCLAIWTLITTSKELGGLGVKDLICMNQTLLLKCM